MHAITVGTRLHLPMPRNWNLPYSQHGSGAEKWQAPDLAEDASLEGKHTCMNSEEEVGSRASVAQNDLATYSSSYGHMDMRRL